MIFLKMLRAYNVGSCPVSERKNETFVALAHGAVSMHAFHLGTALTDNAHAAPQPLVVEGVDRPSVQQHLHRCKHSFTAGGRERAIACPSKLDLASPASGS